MGQIANRIAINFIAKLIEKFKKWRKRKNNVDIQE